eukprot:797790-Amphidinium_carterae.2
MQAEQWPIGLQKHIKTTLFCNVKLECALSGSSRPARNCQQAYPACHDSPPARSSEPDTDNAKSQKSDAFHPVRCCLLQFNAMVTLNLQGLFAYSKAL